VLGNDSSMLATAAATLVTGTRAPTPGVKAAARGV
jgi:hypothetical protein